MEFEKTNLNIDAMKAIAEEKLQEEETKVVGQDLSFLKTEEMIKAEEEKAEEVEEETEIDEDEDSEEIDDLDWETVDEEDAETIEELFESDEEKPTPIKVETPAPKIDEDEIEGVVISKKDLNESKTPAIGDLSPDILKRVDDYEEEMDEDIKNLSNYHDEIVKIMKEKGADITNKEMMEAIRHRYMSAGIDVNDIKSIKEADIDISDIIENKAGDSEEVNSDEVIDNTEQEFKSKYDEAIVLIDKIGMGQVINFTDSERAKLERSKVIKLNEIENVNLKQIRLKKAKNDTPIEQILKRGKKAFTTNIACVASGYTAVMRGGSSYEIIEILKEVQNYLLDTENKWRLIYEKIESMSIGKPETFEEWLSITAAADYEIFIYGILVATYPEEDTIQFNCENPDCKKIHFEFEHKYTTRSLLRAEKMSDKFKERFQATIDNSYSLSDAKAFAETAPVNTVRRIELPESGYVIDFSAQSAYDYINTSIKSLSDKLDQKYAIVSVLSTSVRHLFIPDIDGGLDENGEYGYFQIEEPMDIIKALFTLTDRDLAICNEISDQILNDITFDFGLMNIECPRCHKKTLEYSMSLDRILFQRLQHATDIRIE